MRIALLALCLTSIAYANDGFALHSGDRVVFYGDSITDNTPYTRYVETFTTTRYPNLNVAFYNAGVGGDRVSGGWMGPIKDRLPRDLFSRRPTVITVMLGMNDASYRSLDQGIFNSYQEGYKHIVDEFHKNAPSAKVWLFRPSPYDDVTRAPGWTEGYNSVLLKYADFVESLAKQNSYGVVDQNAPLIELLTKAKAADPGKASQIIGDRVHPSEAGHYVMAWQVLKAWGASPVVSSVEIDSATGTHRETRTTLSQVVTGPKVSWTQTDSALPFPFAKGNDLVRFVLANSALEEAMNQQPLVVTHLAPGSYTLSIDGKSVGSFTDAQLSAGINLATLETPMMAQAHEVENLVNRRTQIAYNNWRNFENGLGDYKSKARTEAVKALWNLSSDMQAKAHALAKPVARHYELVKN